jgi:hypothetical protein
MLFHRDEAGALPNSQSTVVADGRSMTNTIMPQRTTDSLVNIAANWSPRRLLIAGNSDGTLARLGSCAIALLLARHKRTKP